MQSRPLLALAALPLAVLLMLPSTFRHASADRPTVSVDQLRTGWDPAEPNLTPAAVTTGGFGELFHVAIDGVVNASPVTARAVVVVATEHDWVYGIDENTGGKMWQVSAGQFGDDHGCNQVSPATDVGITSTPVIDPATSTVYVIARDFHGASNTAWRLHALDLFTGHERPGWPVTIAGQAHNAGTVFDAYQHEARPGLLLLGGTVFAGFGSFCDVDPYQGWIASVSTTSRAQSLYVDVPSALEGAFWASGAGFVADGPNTFLATSANPPRGSGTGQAPPGDGHVINGSTNLADAVIRFQVGGDGITVTPTNYFSPIGTDTTDADLGSSGLSSLPDSMGIAGHPHLGVVGGKFGTLFVLDRDNLGGRQTGDAGAVSKLTGTDNLFGHVASWPGDGGFVYDNGTAHLNAFRLGPTGRLTRVAGLALSYGSSSPLVTSNGTQSGSATLWEYDRSSHELRAYNAVPAGAALTEIFHHVVGATGDAHFNEVSADQGRVLVAADDSFLHVFGVAGLPAVPCNCGRPPPHSPSDAQGYWEVASDGGIFPWGNAGGYGSHGGSHLNKPIVGMAANPNGGGYWLVARDGGVFPFGPNAGGFGSMGGRHLNQPIVGMAATPSGHGYYLVAADGGIFPFGDAVGYGSTGGVHLNRSIVGMAGAPAGSGYWLVASDGGIFPFGPGAGGFGSTGGIHLNQPVVGMAATRDGTGYWLVARDGGIFPFGDAIGYGSTGGLPLNQPMVGIATS